MSESIYRSSEFMPNRMFGMMCVYRHSSSSFSIIPSSTGCWAFSSAASLPCLASWAGSRAGDLEVERFAVMVFSNHSSSSFSIIPSSTGCWAFSSAASLPKIPVCLSRVHHTEGVTFLLSRCLARLKTVGNIFASDMTSFWVFSGISRM